MKRRICILAILAVLSSQCFGQLEEEQKWEVTFGKIGTLKTKEKVWIVGTEVKRTDSEVDFKSKGIFGAIARKVFPKGPRTTIVNLLEMNIYSIDPKKKRCTVGPVRPVLADSVEQGVGGLKDIFNAMKADREKHGDVEDDNPIEVVRSQFEVHKKGGSKKIRDFSTERFWINGSTMSRDTRSGKTWTDSLSIDLDMTPKTDVLERAQKLQRNFAKAHFDSLGLEAPSISRDLLGGNWLQKLGELQGDKGEDQYVSPAYANMADEMSKLDGYYSTPIAMRGRIFRIEPKPEDAVASSSGADDDIQKKAKKKLGRFGKKMLGGGNEEKELDSILDFKGELIKLILRDIDPARMRSDYDCKQES